MAVDGQAHGVWDEHPHYVLDIDERHFHGGPLEIDIVRDGDRQLIAQVRVEKVEDTREALVPGSAQEVDGYDVKVFIRHAEMELPDAEAKCIAPWTIRANVPKEAQDA